MVEWVDGSMIAQMSQPNMLFPIQYALTYPERLEGILPPFDFHRYPSLEFLQPSAKKFPCLDLAFEALRRGGSAPCYLNAANEVLVERFLRKEIGWREIGSRLEALFCRHEVEKIINVEKILEIDMLAREQASEHG
jgi:1-deoxy-D-xylulose-5-phosphate reductoisomerase